MRGRGRRAVDCDAMADLPTWVTLSLREPLDAEQFVRRAKDIGVRADITRDGIQLPAAFLARIEPGPFAPRRLDRSVSDGEIDVGAASLHISGGTNDLARSEHQQPSAIRVEVREAAVRRAAVRQSLCKEFD